MKNRQEKKVHERKLLIIYLISVAQLRDQHLDILTIHSPKEILQQQNK